eukprot:3304488-Rhodomonas_salina.2
MRDARGRGRDCRGGSHVMVTLWSRYGLKAIVQSRYGHVATVVTLWSRYGHVMVTLPGVRRRTASLVAAYASSVPDIA